MDESGNIIFGRKPFHQMLSMLIDPTNQIIGNPHIERAVSFACKNIDPQSALLGMDAKIKSWHDALPAGVLHYSRHCKA